MKKTSTKRIQIEQAQRPVAVSLAPTGGNPGEKIRFLDSWGETILLAIPTISLILTVVGWTLGRFNLSNLKITEVTSLLVSLLFIDGVHVVFTFMAILCVPELWQWSVSDANKPTQGLGKGMKFWIRAGLVAAFLGVTIYFLRISPTVSLWKGMLTAWFFLELLGPAQHTIAQMRGISFCYNSLIRKNFKFSEDEKTRAIQAEKIEKFFFRFLLIGQVGYFIPEVFSHENIPVVGSDALQYACAGLLVVSTLVLIINAFRYPRRGETRKAFYLSRLLLLPLNMFNAIAGLGIRAAHGTEYLLIFRQMLQKSSLSSARRKRLYWMTAGASLLYAVAFVLTWPNAIHMISNWETPQTLINVALFTTFVVRFTHYYTDSVLYKMSNPNTRTTVAPLLVPAPQLVPVPQKA